MNRNEYKQLQKQVPKYRAVPTIVHGKKFASKKEAHRYRELLLLTDAGVINGLRCQVSFSLEVNNIHICKYIADFVYFENGGKIVEDVKGFLNPVYRLKKKLMKAIFDITIRET